MDEQPPVSLFSLSCKFLFPESVQPRKGKEKSPFSLTCLAWRQCTPMNRCTHANKKHAHHHVQKKRTSWKIRQKDRRDIRKKQKDTERQKTEEWKDANRRTSPIKVSPPTQAPWRCAESLLSCRARDTSTQNLWHTQQLASQPRVLGGTMCSLHISAWFYFSPPVYAGT